MWIFGFFKVRAVWRCCTIGTLGDPNLTRVFLWELKLWTSTKINVLMGLLAGVFLLSLAFDPSCAALILPPVDVLILFLLSCLHASTSLTFNPSLCNCHFLTGWVNYVAAFRPFDKTLGSIDLLAYKCGNNIDLWADLLVESTSARVSSSDFDLRYLQILN